MSQTMITFRMDQELKKSMEQTCADMGLTMTAAFTIFAKKVVRRSRRAARPRRFIRFFCPLRHRVERCRNLR